MRPPCERRTRRPEVITMSLADQAIQREVSALIAILVGARRDRGDLPQRRLATLLGVAAHSVQDWETGTDVPTVRHLIAWARLVALKLAVLDDRGRQIRRPLVREHDEPFETYELRRLTVILRELRNAHPRVTQHDLARAAGVSHASIARWENLTVPPRTTGLVRWARSLDCQITFIPFRTT